MVKACWLSQWNNRLYSQRKHNTHNLDCINIVGFDTKIYEIIFPGSNTHTADLKDQLEDDTDTTKASDFNERRWREEIVEAYLDDLKYDLHLRWSEPRIIKSQLCGHKKTFISTDLYWFTAALKFYGEALEHPRSGE